VSHLNPQVNFSLKRLSHGSKVKSHELMHEPGVIELGFMFCLSCFSDFVSNQCVFDSMFLSNVVDAKMSENRKKFRGFIVTSQKNVSEIGVITYKESERVIYERLNLDRWMIVKIVKNVVKRVNLDR